MDDNELNQRLLGLITLVYGVSRESVELGELSPLRSPEVASGIKQLTDELITWELQGQLVLPELTAEAVQGLIETCVRNVADQVGQQTYSILWSMLALFNEFTMEVATRAPDLDVQALLREMALRNATEG